MRYLLIITFALISSLGFTQNVEKAIKISKEVGRTIDSTECRIYKLDFCSEDFVSAQVISISGSTMMLRITKLDTTTERFFSNKELTNLKIKVGDKKYSKKHLESMTTTQLGDNSSHGRGSVIVGLVIIGASLINILTFTRQPNVTIDFPVGVLFAPIGIVLVLNGFITYVYDKIKKKNAVDKQTPIPN